MKLPMRGVNVPALVLAVLAAGAIDARAGASGSQADLRLDGIDDGRLRVAPGDVLTYEVVAFNAGPSADPAAVVDFTLPPGLINGSWTCTGFSGATCPASGTGNLNATVSLPAQSLVLFSMTATVAPAASGFVTSVAFVSPGPGVDDSNINNNRRGDVDNVSFDMAELVHGFDQTRTLPGAGGDYFRVFQDLFRSYEVVVDATSGDIGTGDGPMLERLGSDGTTVIGTPAVPAGTGPSRSLRWQTVSEQVADQLVHVASRGCSTDCGPDDMYRIRAYDTTYRIARYNNANGQQTFLFIQNTTHAVVNGRIVFWTPGGSPVSNMGIVLQPRQLLVVNTVSMLPSGGGSITVAADAPYGALAGKAVALEAATGFSFDTPMLPLPR